MSKRRITATCTRCDREFTDLDALEDHDCDAEDEDWLRQTGLDGTVGDGQSTLSGGIRPPKRDRDRGQLSPFGWRMLILGWIMILSFGVALAFVAVAGGAL